MSDLASRLRFAITNYADGAISYKGFSALIDIPYRTLQNYLSGERTPNTEALEKLHKNGININWLITGTGSPYLSAELERNLLDKVFLIFSNEILEYAFSDASLFDPRERLRLLSFIMSNNYLGIGETINQLLDDPEMRLELPELEKDLASGDMRGLFDAPPKNQRELWKASQALKDYRLKSSITPFPLDPDAEVGQ